MDKGLICTIDQIRYLSFTPNTWYGDSCVSCTIDSNESGLFDSKEISETITGIASQSVTATKVGNKRMLFLHNDVKITERIMRLVKKFPNVTKWLISITNEMSNRTKLLSNGQNDIILTYPNGD